MNTKNKPTGTKVNKSLKICQWVYASLQLKNWSHKKRNMLAMAIICLLSGLFNGSIYALEMNTLGFGYRDRLLYLVSRAKIDWVQLIMFYEKWIINTMLLISNVTGLPIWLSMDDMHAEKDKRSKRLPKGGKKLKQESYSFVTAVIGVGYFFVPMIPRKCFRNVIAKKLGLTYVPKTKVAISLLDIWFGYGLEKKCVFVLVDSWYSSKKLIKKCMELNFILIACLKCNRLLNNKRIEKYRTGLRKHQRTKALTNKYCYRLYSRIGTLIGITKPITVLLSQRITLSGGRKSWRYIMCSCMGLNVIEILDWYKKRWAVETFHQIWKAVFGVKNWRLQ